MNVSSGTSPPGLSRTKGHKMVVYVQWFCKTTVYDMFVVAPLGVFAVQPFHVICLVTVVVFLALINCQNVCLFHNLNNCTQNWHIFQDSLASIVWNYHIYCKWLWTVCELKQNLLKSRTCALYTIIPVMHPITPVCQHASLDAASVKQKCSVLTVSHRKYVSKQVRRFI